ncbi:WD40-repeat-containing domain [Pseudocohnilembus persalinus]|uniref:WD40-repeat-containing domain n=1 Tax=Pseudocohnilembus persalinus TaxID=266149 RepID=A0A0V0QRG9_PSEPJ|nr:WD40-repeat-containing domain [Pseudocohnilembus persalinus]|eukprot:KRX04895.1 WD40-repeat-containing domain [Pseudocohnilembus persalinus]
MRGFGDQNQQQIQKPRQQGGGPPQGRVSKVCKFFAQSGKCNKGDNCNFSHIVNGPGGQNIGGNQNPSFNNQNQYLQNQGGFNNTINQIPQNQQQQGVQYIISGNMNKLCKFGDKCNKPDCKFGHPNRGQQQSSSIQMKQETNITLQFNQMLYHQKTSTLIMIDNNQITPISIQFGLQSPIDLQKQSSLNLEEMVNKMMKSQQNQNQALIQSQLIIKNEKAQINNDVLFISFFIEQTEIYSNMSTHLFILDLFNPTNYQIIFNVSKNRINNILLNGSTIIVADEFGIFSFWSMQNGKYINDYQFGSDLNNYLRENAQNITCVKLIQGPQSVLMIGLFNYFNNAEIIFFNITTNKLVEQLKIDKISQQNCTNIIKSIDLYDEKQGIYLVSVVSFQNNQQQSQVFAFSINNNQVAQIIKNQYITEEIKVFTDECSSLPIIMQA